MRIDFQDPLDNADFFGHLFRVLFMPQYQGYSPERAHPPPAPLNGARRMYELFKTAVTLTIVRQQHGISESDVAGKRLFDALCIASMNEAQRIVMHIAGYHLRDPERQRALLLDAMSYCQKGGMGAITSPTEPHRLDGLFLEQFDHRDRKALQKKLTELYADKELMVEAAVGFIVIFTCFLSDPLFFLHGVSSSGIQAQPPSVQPPTQPSAEHAL